MKGRTKRAGNLAVQGGILAATSLIVRLIGFFYRIPLYRLLGKEGLGYYSSAFEIYSYMLVISSYALPAALSKIISGKLALKRYKEAHQIFRSALLLGLLLSIVTSSVLYFGAEPLAGLVGNEGSVMSFRALAPSMFLFTFLAVIRGYFQGHNTMIPTAISQVIEQIFNAAFSIGLASLFMTTSVQLGAAGGTLGTAFGILAGLLFVVAIYYMARPMFYRRIAKDTESKGPIDTITGWRIIYMTAVPMIIGTSVYNLSNLVDMILFQRGLLSHGYTPEVVTGLYGLFAGQYKLILTLPISIASALAAASIPSITASMARKEFKLVKRKAIIALKTVMVISVPAAFGLGVLAEPILSMLFGTEDVAITSHLMQMGAVSIIFFSLSGISTGILQGLGQLYAPVRNSAIGIVVKITAFILFIFVFDTGLVGAVVINVVFSLIVSALNFISIQRTIKIRFDYWSDLGAPLLAGGLMSTIALTLYAALMSATNSNGLATLSAISVAGISYFAILLKLGGIDEESLTVLPMGTKLTAIAKRLKLM